ncbi:MAG: carboxypeptidase-like regulatory domain-containing protein, partial [Bacteroidia bacterium]|nr:carboxypeptidase-like regulatory domain-containing protein [Bacteroidia bacterium]
MIRKLLILFFIHISFIAISQNGTVRGFVYNKANGEPVAFSNVYIKGTTIGTSTDLNGFF